MATRKRPAKKAAPKKRTQQNSNIQSAQRAAAQRRLERQDKGRNPEAAAKLEEARKLAEAKAATDPRRLLSKSTLAQNVKPGDSKPDGAPAAKGLSEAANKIAGIASGIMKDHQAEIKKPNPLADASKYGSSGNKARAARLTALMNDRNRVQNKKLTDAGKAVYMGARLNRAKIRNQGPERMDPESGRDTTTEAVGDDIRSADELMSWLADEKTFNQIRDAANKAGIDAQSYDDVAKLWDSVVKQAAATFSTTGKKVTPWAILQLRGKTMVGGKPQSKTTISTTIDEMDPAEAKSMIRNAAANALGRDPTREEIEDFIAKAQTIAKANPNVTTTTTNYGFDGEATDQTSFSRGGGDAVTAQAQEAALEQAKQSEDYTAFQAAGVYMPWLMDALASPI